MTGSSWDAANKQCVAVKLQKPKASLEMEFTEQYGDLRGGGFETLLQGERSSVSGAEEVFRIGYQASDFYH